MLVKTSRAFAEICYISERYNKMVIRNSQVSMAKVRGESNSSFVEVDIGNLSNIDCCVF